jgi:hypothetical protein
VTVLNALLNCFFDCPVQHEILTTAVWAPLGRRRQVGSLHALCSPRHAIGESNSCAIRKSQKAPTNYVRRIVRVQKCL